MDRLTAYQPTEGGIPFVTVKDEQAAFQRLAWYEDKDENGKLIDSQDLMKKTYAAEYDIHVLKSEDMSIRTFAEGYNNCLAHFRQLLIMQHGARPLTKKEIEALNE